MRLVLPTPRGRSPASAWLVPLFLATLLVVVVSAAAAAALETRTVSSFWRGLWWAISLVTTVGFVGEPPETRAGQVLSAVLMVLGFLLLAVVSASLAALIIREEERPWEERDRSSDEALAFSLAVLDERLAAIEARLDRLAAPPATDAHPPPDERPTTDPQPA